MYTPTRTAVAALAATALAVAACGPQAQATIADEPTALEAIAESFAGSWRWTGQLDLAVSDQDLPRLAAIDPYYGEDPDAVSDDIREAVDEAGRTVMHGALGDDGSFQTTWQRDGKDLLDFRIGLQEVLTAESLSPEAQLYARVDVPGIVAVFNEFADDPQDPTEVVRGAAEEARQQIPQPDLRDMVLALVHGDWGGLAGTVDLSLLGIADEDLPAMRDHFRDELIGLADRDTMVALLDEAVTVRDLAPASDGTTVGTLDVHPRAAAFAVYDLFDDADDLAAAATGLHERAEAYPEVLTAVATVTFDGEGDVIEVRTDVIALARELVAAFPEATDPGVAETLEGLTSDTHADVVFGIADHDAVATVLDVDVTAAEWHDLFELFFGGLVGGAVD